MPVIPVIRQPVGGHTQQQIMCVDMAWLYCSKFSISKQKAAFQIPGWGTWNYCYFPALPLPLPIHCLQVWLTSTCKCTCTPAFIQTVYLQQCTRMIMQKSRVLTFSWVWRSIDFLPDTKYLVCKMMSLFAPGAVDKAAVWSCSSVWPTCNSLAVFSGRILFRVHCKCKATFSLGVDRVAHDNVDKSRLYDA